MGAAETSWFGGRADAALAAVGLAPLLARGGGRLLRGGLLRGLGLLLGVCVVHVQGRVERRGYEVEVGVRVRVRGGHLGHVHCAVRWPATVESSRPRCFVATPGSLSHAYQIPPP